MALIAVPQRIRDGLSLPTADEKVGESPFSTRSQRIKPLCSVAFRPLSIERVVFGVVDPLVKLPCESAFGP